MTINRMEIWWANLPHEKGSHVEQGSRPVLILSNRTANLYSPIITVVPVANRTGKKKLPTHVLLHSFKLDSGSYAMCEQMMTIDKNILTSRICALNSIEDFAAIRNALMIQLDLAA